MVGLADSDAAPASSSHTVDYVLEDSLSLEETLDLQLGGEAITLLGFEPVFQRLAPADLPPTQGEIMCVHTHWPHSLRVLVCLCVCVCLFVLQRACSDTVVGLADSMADSMSVQ